MISNADLISVIDDSGKNATDYILEFLALGCEAISFAKAVTSDCVIDSKVIGREGRDMMLDIMNSVQGNRSGGQTIAPKDLVLFIEGFVRKAQNELNI